MDLIERIVESRRIFEGRIVNLRVDTVELPNGRRTTREIVEHKGAVAVVPLLDHSKIVMVKQWRTPVGRTLLEIPAGTLEHDEDPAECAKRELIEEIGYYPGKLTEMFHSYLSPGYSTEMLHTYLAEDLHEARKNRDFDEFLEVEVISLDDAVKKIWNGEIVDAKTICGVLLAKSVFQERCRH